MTTMRRSCCFCRRRKIRCSGELTGCQACVTRSQECLFEASSVMGRPRNNPKKASKLQSPRLEPTDPVTKCTEVINEISVGTSKLRQSLDVRETFALFKDSAIGVLLSSFFEIVSVGEITSEVDGEQTFYEAAFRATPVDSGRTTATELEAKLMMTSACWQRFPSELVSFATVGIGNENGDGAAESFFVRLLKEDQSIPFTSNDEPSVSNPCLALSKEDLLYLVELYFIYSPFSFLLNDSLVLEAIQDGTFDQTLLAIMIAFVISTGSIPLESSSAIMNLTAESLINYVQQSLLATSTEAAAVTVSSLQTLWIYGILLLSSGQARASWAVMVTGLSIARESLKRNKERDSFKTEVEKIEEEQVLSLWWLMGMFLSWCFISMPTLPRAIIHESADAQILPPFTHDSSLSYAYRSRHQHFSTATVAVRKCIRQNNECSRILSLIVTLSLQSSDSSKEAWLLDMAEQHSSSPPDTSTNSFSQRTIKNSPFLSTVHAILALHSLTPFNEPGALDLSAADLRLALSAMRLIISESRLEIRLSIENGEERKVDVEEAKTGVMRLIGDCLPHCLRIIEHLACAASESKEIYNFLSVEKAQISHVLEQLIFLGECGLQIPPSSPTDVSEKRKAGTRSEGKERKRSKSSANRNSETQYSQEVAQSNPNPRNVRASSLSGRRSSIDSVRPLSHHTSLDPIRTQLPSPTPSIQRMTSYSSECYSEYYSPVPVSTLSPPSPGFLPIPFDCLSNYPTQPYGLEGSGLYSHSPAQYSSSDMESAVSSFSLYHSLEDLHFQPHIAPQPNLLPPRYFHSPDLATINGPFGSTHLFLEHAQPPPPPGVESAFNFQF